MKDLPKYSPPPRVRIIDDELYEFRTYFGFSLVYEREGKMVLVNQENGKIELRIN